MESSSCDRNSFSSSFRRLRSADRFSGSGTPPSRGISLTRLAKVVVASSLTLLSLSDMAPRTGTTSRTM